MPLPLITTFFDVSFLKNTVTSPVPTTSYWILAIETFGSLEALFELIWAGATNATAMLLSGQGYFDFRPAGDEISNNATTPTGDVLLSTKNFANGDNYTIIIEFR